MSEVRVIGAGLSGLAAAWYLAEAGARVRVEDAAPGPGGLIRTTRTRDGLVEHAARAFTWSERTAALFRDIGLDWQDTKKTSARRYLYRGRPRRWPLSAAESAGLAGRFAAAWLTRRVSARDGESVADWGRRVLGRPAVDWLVAPALQGIYASPPEALSATALAQARKGGSRRLIAPAGGMGAFIERLHERLAARGVTFSFGATATSLDPLVPTVVATSAPAAARLLDSTAPDLARELRRIQLVSLVTATAFYEPHEADVHGFGILFPRPTGFRALGVVFNADTFEGRGTCRSETWIYGGLDPTALPSTDVDTARAIAIDRRKLTDRDDPPRSIHVVRHPAVFPVYGPAVLDAARTAAGLPPWIAIAGNYLGRLGVSRLIDGAWDARERLLYGSPGA